MAEEKRKSLDSKDENDEGSIEDSNTTILYRTTENISKIFEYQWVKCHSCLKKCNPLFILTHIGASKTCKSFY